MGLTINPISTIDAQHQQAASRVASALSRAGATGSAPATALARTASASATAAAAGASTSSSSSAASNAGQITSSDFLTLLVTELQNQDPTQPTDPNAYINQLVGVNSLQQLISINQDLTPSTATPTTGNTGAATSSTAGVPAAVAADKSVGVATAAPTNSHLGS
jgi:flagellar basal-body rod modification protein FlgD